jgi:L,D-transpeptidase catalytic domain
MKKKLKGFYIVITSVFIYFLHLPLALARSATGNTLFFSPPAPISTSSTDSLHFIPSLKSVYDSLHLGFSGLSQQAFDYAKKGLEQLIAQGRILNDSIISIIDFSQPSSRKRLYILDIKNYRVLFNTFVAHGKNSGREWANSFSNQQSSFKSSPGFYITGEAYQGNNGYSLKLEGIEKGINDNAYQRAIVLHGADYVNEAYIAAQGFIGRSEGCPAVPSNIATPIINSIKDHTCLFIYHPGQSYLKHSSVLG